MNDLAQRRDELVALWFERVMASYPPQAAMLLTKQTDPFANPVGASFRRDLAILFDHFTGITDQEGFDRALDNVCRIRSVQDFAPSQAVGFVLDLKQVLRDQGCWKDAYEPQVDRLLLKAFDVYQQCREDLATVRVNEAHRRTDNLLRQLNRRDEVGT